MEVQDAITMVRTSFAILAWWGVGEGAKYALINVKPLNVIREYLIMCIKVGECKCCSWTIYCRIPTPTYGYMKM